MTAARRRVAHAMTERLRSNATRRQLAGRFALLAVKGAMAIDGLVQERRPRLTLRDRMVPVLALSKQEAAQALGVSLNFFEQEIAHELKMIRRGRRRLVAVRELERWLEHEADLAGSY